MVGFKNRYLVMEVFLDPNKEFTLVLKKRDLAIAIKDSILKNFGECGLASAMSSFTVKDGISLPSVIYWNPITKLFILRTSREEYQKIWAAITMVKSVGNCPAVLNLLDLSGSIRACKTAALKFDELKFEQYKLSAGDRLSATAQQEMQNYLEMIKILAH